MFVVFFWEGENPFMWLMTFYSCPHCGRQAALGDRFRMRNDWFITYAYDERTTLLWCPTVYCSESGR